MKKRHPASVTGERGRFDLRTFSLEDMYRCSAELRALGRTASDSDDVARQVTSYLFEQLVRGETSVPGCALVRLFRTQAASSGDGAHTLSLRASRGLRTEWDDPALSKRHRLLPLASPDLLSGMPMVNALVSELGVPAKLFSGVALGPTDPVPLFDVFHVEQARGSSFVPDQEEFVERYGIESVLGFGGVLPPSEVFIAVLFATVRIPGSTAELFKSIAPSVGLALLTPEREPDSVEARARSYEEVLRHQEEIALERQRQLQRGTRQLDASLAELRQAEESLRRREEHLRAVIETTPECVKLIARDGTLLQMNSSGLRLIGAASPELVIGRSMYELVVPEHRDAWRAFNERVCAGEKGTLEFDISGLPAGRRHMETHAAPLVMSDGSTVQLSVTRDVTERRRAEGALLEASNRKDEFIAMLSHELRNPLASLRSAVDLVRVTKPDEGKMARAYEVMDRQLSHLVRMVDDLLEASRIGRGMLELNRERIELGTVVRNAVDSCEGLIRKAGQRLEIERSHHPLWVDGDPVRLVQILSNLLTNATRFAEGPGLITIASEERDGEALLSVRDTGSGFAPEEATNLFEMFTKSERSSGLGLGLALTRRLVELHGGSIEARSAGVGRGAEFIVRLPLAEVEASATYPELVSSDPEAPTACRVLVADDNRDAAEMLAELLRALGSEVSIAYDGAEAVGLARALQPDLVLLDIGMPKLDGYEAAQRIRSDSGQRSVMIVAVTGWGQTELRRRVERVGFDEHMVKPVTLGALRALLDSRPRL